MDRCAGVSRLAVQAAEFLGVKPRSGRRARWRPLSSCGNRHREAGNRGAPSCTTFAMPSAAGAGQPWRAMTASRRGAEPGRHESRTTPAPRMRMCARQGPGAVRSARLRCRSHSDEVIAGCAQEATVVQRCEGRGPHSGRPLASTMRRRLRRRTSASPGGTDVGMQSAALTLAGGDLRALVRARRLSRATVRTGRTGCLPVFTTASTSRSPPVCSMRSAARCSTR